MTHRRLSGSLMALMKQLTVTAIAVTAVTVVIVHVNVSISVSVTAVTSVAAILMMPIVGLMAVVNDGFAMCVVPFYSQCPTPPLSILVLWD